ncbi:MAG: hypothetical protein A2498_10020 [Lentisphaerae bacterium RIFOXYC12_FULL_60_16]|nr:MAG: hypothetical protein A2498_10020 [Lentisphaerae bacterium RIFOXYC12_FULL_60_16]OGV72512.1 MAG: hypothetical protein A2269_03785 [Lentisphaerae bacterium RIFOXYA12_FULL_60_10]OGV84771.1 MAG: hypothetical protein A2340_04420 [Lentisphaerae bacterium RIFOXYB12_FULL_60_10]
MIQKPNRIHTILVVDDDPEELASTCAVLGARYPVLAATNGKDALNTARMAHPSAIVLDVMMPDGKNGFSVFFELNKDPATHGIPVIFLTHVNQSTGLPFGSAEMEPYLGCRPAAFLEKPVEDAQLLFTVETVLSQAGRNARIDPLCKNP